MFKLAENYDGSITYVLVQEDVCGAGYYDVRAPSTTATYALVDCSGVPTAYQHSYTATTGYVRLDQLAMTPSNPDSTAPVTTSATGFLAIDDGAGVAVTGWFSVSLSHLPGEVAPSGSCAASGGDEDGDGGVDDGGDGVGRSG